MPKTFLRMLSIDFRPAFIERSGLPPGFTRKRRSRCIGDFTSLCAAAERAPSHHSTSTAIAAVARMHASVSTVTRSGSGVAPTPDDGSTRTQDGWDDVCYANWMRTISLALPQFGFFCGLPHARSCWSRESHCSFLRDHARGAEVGQSGTALVAIGAVSHDSGCLVGVAQHQTGARVLALRLRACGSSAQLVIRAEASEPDPSTTIL